MKKTTKKTTKKQAKSKAEIKGINPISLEPNVLIIAGVERKLRRLNVKDTFKLAQMTGVACAALGKDLTEKELTPDGIQQLLVAGFVYSGDVTIEFMSDVVGVSKEDILNPDLFPMGSEIQILSAIAHSQDAKYFFGICKTILLPMIMSKVKEITSQKASTESNIDTDGQTK